MIDATNLLELQRVDSAADAIRTRLEDLDEAKAVAAVNVLIKHAADANESIAGKVKDLEAARDRLDDEVRGITARVDVSNRKLMSGDVANPRELTALQSDVEMLCRKRSELEDAELEILVELDERSAELASSVAELERLDAQRRELVDHRDAVITDLEADLDGFDSQRTTCREPLDRVLLARYDRTRSRGGGVAAAELSGKVCQACHMTLPAEDIYELEQAEVPLCPNCDAILIVLHGAEQ